jgi:hypothetical protein
MSSCTIEQKLAKGFIDHPPQISIQLFTPETLFKYNHKGEMIEGFDSLSPEKQDSALYYSSEFIQYISDSTYLEKYVNAYIDELRNLGFKVYVEESMDTFLRGEPQSYIVTMAQVQLDEYIYPFEDSEEFGDSTFYKRFDLNAVDASSWFELSKMNAEKPGKTILKSTFTATDGFEGNFVLSGFASNVVYKYKIDPLTIQDLYDLAVYAGKKHADYLFDWFLNQYVRFHMPEGQKAAFWFHYNLPKHSLEITGDEKFEVVQSK